MNRRARGLAVALPLLLAAALVAPRARADEPSPEPERAPLPTPSASPDCAELAEAQSYARLARARLAVRNAAGSTAAIRHAVRLSPRCAPYWAALGDALWLEGRVRPARSAWRVALRLDPEEPVARARLPVEAEYGLEILAVELAAIGLLFVSPYLAIATYLLGPPIVHLAHANFWGAGASAVLRLALPLVGLALGVGDDPGAGLAGLVVALFVVELLDSTMLARMSAEPQPPRWPSSP